MLNYIIGIQSAKSRLWETLVRIQRQPSCLWSLGNKSKNQDKALGLVTWLQGRLSGEEELESGFCVTINNVGSTAYVTISGSCLQLNGQGFGKEGPLNFRFHHRMLTSQAQEPCLLAVPRLLYKATITKVQLLAHSGMRG